MKKKVTLIKYLLNKKKHLLVEKPLVNFNDKLFKDLKNTICKNNLNFYTAYNHRFEPHFIKMKEYLQKKIIGKVYYVKLFYGNGTARIVKNSIWRDKGSGVLKDLGSHLLDTIDFWFNSRIKIFILILDPNLKIIHMITSLLDQNIII